MPFFLTFSINIVSFFDGSKGCYYFALCVDGEMDACENLKDLILRSWYKSMILQRIGIQSLERETPISEVHSESVNVAKKSGLTSFECTFGQLFSTPSNKKISPSDCEKLKMQFIETLLESESYFQKVQAHHRK